MIRGPILRNAAIFYGAGLLLHTADHLRRGADVLSPSLKMAGAISTVAGMVAIMLVLSEHPRRAAMAVVIGLPVALGTAAAHLLPAWSSFSDAFPGAGATGVTAFSWAVVIGEIAGAALMGIAGAEQLRRERATASHEGGLA